MRIEVHCVVFHADVCIWCFVQFRLLFYVYSMGLFSITSLHLTELDYKQNKFENKC